MEAEAREQYMEALRTTGAPPKWELLMRDPKFRAAVEQEDQRIRDQASLEITERRAREASLMRDIREQQARARQRVKTLRDFHEQVAPQRQRPTKGLLGLPTRASDLILKQLGEDILNVRTTNSANKRAVTDYAQQIAPYPNKVIFGTATSGHWPKSFAKGEYTKAEIGLKENMSLGWEEYQKAVKYRERFGSNQTKPGVFAERMDDNRYIFQQNMEPSRRSDLERTGRLFAPSHGAWTPQMNDAWLLGMLHSGAPLHLVSEPSRETLRDRHENRPTQTGREVALALRSGYRIDDRGPSPSPNEPFRSGGTVLRPSGEHPPARVQDAVGVGDEFLLNTFRLLTQGRHREPTMTESWRGPNYGKLTKAAIEDNYRIQNMSGLETKIKRVFGFAEQAAGYRKKGRNDLAKEPQEKMEKELADANRLLRQHGRREDLPRLEQLIRKYMKKGYEDLANRFHRPS